jgi:hypothetical protein
LTLYVITHSNMRLGACGVCNTFLPTPSTTGKNPSCFEPTPCFIVPCSLFRCFRSLSPSHTSKKKEESFPYSPPSFQPSGTLSSQVHSRQHTHAKTRARARHTRTEHAHCSSQPSQDGPPAQSRACLLQRARPVKKRKIEKFFFSPLHAPTCATHTPPSFHRLNHLDHPPLPLSRLHLPRRFTRLRRARKDMMWKMP